MNLGDKQTSLFFIWLAGLSWLVTPLTAYAATLNVCPTCTLKLPSQAASIAKDGDTIEIEAGPYLQDAAVWRANNLSIRGINGKAQLLSQGTTVEGKGIWVIKGNDTTIENIEFVDARVPNKNGAGIRQEGTNLYVKHCVFRHNENGILAGANPHSEIVIEQSEFDSNGHGDGKSHNLYVGAIHSLLLRNNHIHGAHVGHQIKSRAAATRIFNNRIEDGPEGDSSYLIDLPAGGNAEITGNRLEQGARAQNATMIAYGAEKILHSENSLIVEDNQFINKRVGQCLLVKIYKGLVNRARFYHNSLSGCKDMQGLIDAADNINQVGTDF